MIQNYFASSSIDLISKRGGEHFLQTHGTITSHNLLPL